MNRRVLWLGVVVWLGAASRGVSGVLDGIELPKEFRAMRSSSADPNWQHGNGDCRAIATGETLVLAELKGPGRVTHIWFTIMAQDKWYSRMLVLRAWWDGEEHPSIECPIGDFFCVGHGLDRPVNSLPIRVSSNGRARNCYFPMPFRRSAKIAVSNEGEHGVAAFFWSFDWQKLESLPADTPTFHAMYRQECPCQTGRDYVILEAEGKGHYVGCNLSVRCSEPGWWGEGDDRFYIDGEREPSLQGTGSEDYFCDAWGLRELQGAFYGCPVMEGLDTGDRTTAYRFHLTDPVPFEKSLEVAIEHKGARQHTDGSWSGFVERADDYASVAYWYQTEPHREFPALPPARQRSPFRGAVVLEAEDVLPPLDSSGEPCDRQDLPGWGGGGHLFFRPSATGSFVVVAFTVVQEADYQILLDLTTSWDYGMYKFAVDDVPAGKALDLYSDEVSTTSMNLGQHHLRPGKHSLRCECVGQNPLSEGYFFGLDTVVLALVRRP